MIQKRHPEIVHRPPQQSRLKWRVFLAVLLLMNTRTFQFFPTIRTLEEVWLLLCLVSFLLLYPIFKMKANWRFTGFEAYLLGMTAVLVVLPAVTSYGEFGQPLAYGLLARRSAILITTWLLFYNAWRSGWVVQEDIEVVLPPLIWGTFAIFSLMRLVLNPVNFTDAPPGFLVASGTVNVAFAVPGSFIVFGVLYYMCLGIRQNRLKYYCYSALLLINAVGSSGRFLLVSVIITVIYFMVLWGGILRSLLSLSRIAVATLIVIGPFAILYPDVIALRASKFVDALQVVTGGSQGQDESANARVVESRTATPYIRNHPFLGVGIISAQWGGGTQGAIGDYFYADDIGFLGVLFSYGIVGLMLFGYQFKYALMAGRRMPRGYQSQLLDSTQIYVFFSAVYSVTTGSFVFKFETTAFFVMLMVLVSEDLNRGNVRRTALAPNPAHPRERITLAQT